MKKDIHPKYNQKTAVTCACGASFTVGSTMDKMEVEICSSCHPFYTGNDKILDSAGRVDRFKKRAAVAKTKK
jgi:large subunit ribosomal protein L31